MSQMSLMGWGVKAKPRRWKAYIFTMDIPRLMLPGLVEAGPFRRGDMVSEGALPLDVWRVLLQNGAVEVYVFTEGV